MRHILPETHHWRGDILRYAAAFVAVSSVAALAAMRLGDAPSDTTAEVDQAVIVDLPPLASERAESVAATQGAAPLALRPPQAKPTSPKPPVPPPDQVSAPAPLPPQPAQPAPPAADPPPPVPQPPPKPIEAEPAAPTGAQAASDAADAEQPHAAAHAITLWQKALLRRLEAAKHGLAGRVPGVGTVEIVFTIDTNGALVSERVASSSGLEALDRRASEIVRQAAPFPAPPAGARTRDLVFKIPIRFRH